MLIACNECSQRQYTDVSPLWFVCDRCMRKYHKEQRKRYLEDLKQIQEEFETSICDGCGIEHKTIYLDYVSMWDGYFCLKCIEVEERMIK